MPDPTHETVSSSQVAGLFGISPWETPFTLYHEFRNGITTERDSELMSWGRRLQDDILEATAERLGLEVIEHDQDDYLRHPDMPVGATPDGFVLDPERGLGWIEAKNVSGWAFRSDWSDTTAPLYYELQHQTQLMVPHPEHGMPQWGMIAALVDGHAMAYYPREPDMVAQTGIGSAAVDFLTKVKVGEEPASRNVAVELPTLVQLYPEVTPGKVLQLLGDDEAQYKAAQIIADFKRAKEELAAAEKTVASYQRAVLELVQDAAIVETPDLIVRISKAQIARRRRANLTIAGPDEFIHPMHLSIKKAGKKHKVEIKTGAPEEQVLNAKLILTPADAAAAEVDREGYSRTTFKFEEREEAE